MTLPDGQEKDPCRLCDRAVELAGKDTVYCPDCKFMPTLDSANKEAVDLIEAISFGLFDSMGGVNFGAIDAGLKLLDIPEERHRVLWRKVAVYVSTVREHQDKENPKDSHATMKAK